LKIEQIRQLLVAVLLTLLFYIVGQNAGPVAIVTNFLIPLPIAYVTMAGGMTVGLFALIITSVTVLFLSAPAALLTYLLQFGIGSLLLPVFWNRLTWDKAVVYTLGIVVSAIFLSGLAYCMYSGGSIQVLVDQYIQAEVDTAISLYRQIELPVEQFAELEKILVSMGRFARAAWPALLTCVGASVLLVTLLFLQKAASRFRSFSDLPFSQWKLPDSLIWILICSGFVAFLLNGVPANIAVNLLVVLLPSYFLQGLAIVTYFFQKKAVPPFFRVFGYMLLTVMNPFPLVVTGVGIFDLWIDFRKPRVKNP